MTDETNTVVVEKKEKLPPIESLWATYIISKQMFAVELDLDGNPMLYGWCKKEKYWKIMTDTELAKEVTQWINVWYPERYSVRAVASCKEITETHVYTYGRKLIKSRDFNISTINHILEVKKDGKISVIDKIENAATVKKYFCRTHVSVDLGNNIGNYYKPKTTKEIEESTEFFGKIMKTGVPGNKNRAIFQEFFGDTLNPELRKVMAVMIGKPNGGKSQIMKCLLGLHANSCTINLTKTSGFAYSPVIGKSMVVIDEIGHNPNETMIKQLCGGAIMSVERKYLPTVSIEPDFKIFAGDNGEFKINEKSNAVAARMYFFQIEEVLEADRIDEIGLKAVKNELREILDWALNGAIEVVKRGRMLRHHELPSSSQILMQRLKENTNPCIDFIKDFGIVYDEECLMPKQDIFDQFRQWCDKTGRSGFARVSLPVFVRDVWNKGIKSVYAEYDETLERRASISVGMSKKRVECFPIRITNAPEVRVAQIDKDEVKTSYEDASAYNPNNLPKHILERIQKEVDAIEKMVKLNAEQKEMIIQKTMSDEGYTQEADGSWSKGSEDLNF